MTNNKKTSILNWVTRGLIILYVLFISLFALDATEGIATVGEKVIAIFMHLLPSLLLLFVLLIVWKRQLIGAILFMVLAIVFTVFFNTYKDLIIFLIISLPLFVISLISYLSYKYSKK